MFGRAEKRLGGEDERGMGDIRGRAVEVGCLRGGPVVGGAVMDEEGDSTVVGSYTQYTIYIRPLPGVRAFGSACTRGNVRGRREMARATVHALVYSFGGLTYIW